jgi:hypothetical protein
MKNDKLKLEISHISVGQCSDSRASLSVMIEAGQYYEPPRSYDKKLCFMVSLRTSEKAHHTGPHCEQARGGGGQRNAKHRPLQ